MKRIPVLGVGIDAGSFRDHVAAMMAWAQQRESRMVCVANVHMVMEADADPSFSAVLRTSDLVTPDGMPLVWALRRQGVPAQERVAGMDLVGALCAEAERRGVAVFFLGCTEGVLQATRARLESEYPRLRIAGMHPPPFRALTAVEDRAVVEMINASGAGLVMVALGCPKQERWIHAHRGAVRAVMVGIGAALPVLAGLEGRAPAWMRRAGLEWLYRLGQNPRRLWKRYLVTNSLFIWKAMSLLAAERLRRRSPRRPPTSGQRG